MLLITFASTFQSQAMYSVGPLTKAEAHKSGITVKSRTNGEAGTKVWLEIKKDSPLALGDLGWIELRMTDEKGKHLLSTRLQSHPIVYGQPKNITTFSFSVDPSQLGACSFWLYRGGGLIDGRVFTIQSL